MTPKQEAHKIANAIRAAAERAHQADRPAFVERVQEQQRQVNAIRTELGLPPVYTDEHGNLLDPLGFTRPRRLR